MVPCYNSPMGWDADGWADWAEAHRGWLEDAARYVARTRHTGPLEQTQNIPNPPTAAILPISDFRRRPRWCDWRRRAIRKYRRIEPVVTGLGDVGPSSHISDRAQATRHAARTARTASKS